jgi:hypothetical protein
MNSRRSVFVSRFNSILVLLWILLACGSGNTKDVITKTEVRTVGGKPVVFINGTQNSNLMMTDVYHYRDNINPYELPYGDDWVAGMKTIIDAAAAIGTQIVSFKVWWNEVDKAQARPTPVTRDLDFSPIDAVMDYAHAKNILIMLSPEPHKMIPRWWVDEADIPSLRLDRNTSLCIPKDQDAEVSCIPQELCGVGEPCCTTATTLLYCCDPVLHLSGNICQSFPLRVARQADGMIPCTKTNGEPYLACDSCATDAFGWEYPFASVGNSRMREDFGAYLGAVVERYKNHPALFGWRFTIGSTGEDVYGDYTEMTLFGGAFPQQISDYSPFFGRQFFAWLAAKYATNTAIRVAWGIPDVDLNTPVIPRFNALFAGGNPAPGVLFPDLLDDDNYLSPFSVLSPAGKDFFEFRFAQRDADRKFYVAIIKTADPEHILLSGTGFEKTALVNTVIDGAVSNPGINGGETDNAYDIRFVFTQLQRTTQHSKIMFYAIENGYGCGAANENANQLLAIERVGKAAKCAGAYFGYVSEIRQKTNGDGQTMPSWTSVGAQQAILNIANYTPDSGCGATFRQAGAPFCGDGTCDVHENSVTCPQDCH